MCVTICLSGPHQSGKRSNCYTKNYQKFPDTFLVPFNNIKKTTLPPNSKCISNYHNKTYWQILINSLLFKMILCNQESFGPYSYLSDRKHTQKVHTNNCIYLHLAIDVLKLIHVSICVIKSKHLSTSGKKEATIVNLYMQS